MSGITIPERIPTPLLSHLNYRRNYGVCIVKRGRPAQCRHAREPYTERKVCARDQRISSFAVDARRNLPFHRSCYLARRIFHFTSVPPLISDDNVKMVVGSFENASRELRRCAICMTLIRAKRTHVYGVKEKIARDDETPRTHDCRRSRPLPMRNIFVFRKL